VRAPKSSRTSRFSTAADTVHRLPTGVPTVGPAVFRGGQPRTQPAWRTRAPCQTSRRHRGSGPARRCSAARRHSRRRGRRRCRPPCSGADLARVAADSRRRRRRRGDGGRCPTPPRRRAAAGSRPSRGRHLAAGGRHRSRSGGGTSSGTGQRHPTPGRVCGGSGAPCPRGRRARRVRRLGCERAVRLHWTDGGSHPAAGLADRCRSGGRRARPAARHGGAAGPALAGPRRRIRPALARRVARRTAEQPGADGPRLCPSGAGRPAGAGAPDHPGRRTAERRRRGSRPSATSDVGRGVRHQRGGRPARRGPRRGASCRRGAACRHDADCRRCKATSSRPLLGASRAVRGRRRRRVVRPAGRGVTDGPAPAASTRARPTAPARSARRAGSRRGASSPRGRPP
jgi:hypothetical protein